MSNTDKAPVPYWIGYYCWALVSILIMLGAMAASDTGIEFLPMVFLPVWAVWFLFGDSLFLRPSRFGRWVRDRVGNRGDLP